MSLESRGLWSKIFGTKKSSGCCSLSIEEVPEDAAPEEGDAVEAAPQSGPDAQQPEPAPCCGGAKTPTRGGGRSCCG